MLRRKYEYEPGAFAEALEAIEDTFGAEPTAAARFTALVERATT